MEKVTARLLAMVRAHQYDWPLDPGDILAILIYKKNCEELGEELTDVGCLAWLREWRKREANTRQVRERRRWRGIVDLQLT